MLAAGTLTLALGDLPVESAALDVLTFAGSAGLMLAVGLLASYVPARRASGVDPLAAIREA